MKKVAVIACSLLCSYPTFNHAKISPLKLESGILSIADGTVINASTIHLIEKYKTQVNQFMRHKYIFSDGKYSLPECVRLEDADVLSQEYKQMLPIVLQEFIDFSKQFLDYLQHVKNGVVPLIEEDCAKRKRKDSLLLKWAVIPMGDEERLFFSEITSYRALCAFCLDILCFLEDLEYSCPEASKRYNQELAYQQDLRNHIDEMLSTDSIVLSTDDYKKLLQIVSGQKKHLKKDEVISLYQKNIKTFCA